MLKKITTGVFNSSSKRAKKKIISKGHTDRINKATNSKEKVKEIRGNKTPLYSPGSKNRPIKGDFYSITENNIKDKKIPTKRTSPKKSEINYSLETRRINSKKNDKINKSYFKEKKTKTKTKSKFKCNEFNSKEKNIDKSSFVQNNNRNRLIFKKNELKTNELSFSPKKLLNNHLNNNWSFNDISFNNNINSISFHNKSKKIESNQMKKRNYNSHIEKVKFNHSKISNKLTNKSKSRSKTKSKSKNNKSNICNSYSNNSIETKPKLFSLNNNYSFYNNYSLYIIDDENNIDNNNRFNKSSTEKEFIKIINQKDISEYRIIENLLKLEQRNWYDELYHISVRINKNGEISKNFNEILEKYILIYEHFNWIIYSLSVYFKSILDETEKNKFSNNFFNNNFIHKLNNNIELWKNGFKWKNLYIKVIPCEKAKLLINEIKALNYFFFEYLQLIDTNSIIKKNNYIKKAQLSYNIIFPLIGYSKIANYILFVSVLIKPDNKNYKKNFGNCSSDMNTNIDEIIEQSNKIINYYTSICDNSSNISTSYKTNVSTTGNNNQINNNSLFNNKQNKIIQQMNINKNNDLNLENSLGEIFYVKDLMQSKLFRQINNYNLIKIKDGKYLIFNLARFIPNLFDIKFKYTQKLNFYSEFNKEKKYFTLYQNHLLNKSIHDIPHKYIKTAEDVIDKVYNMKNTYYNQLNYKEIFINNIYFKIIYEKSEKTKKDYKTKTFIDHLFNFESSEVNDEIQEQKLKDNHIYNSSNISKNNNEEKNYIKGKYVILFDLIEPIKLDYSLIKNNKSKNEAEQMNELYFLRTNYFSHFYNWCEMLNKNNFNIKSYCDLKYFMKKYSINSNLLYFSLVYIRNQEISDIIKIHLLIKIINQIFIRDNSNIRDLISIQIPLYIKNILFPHELSFGNETKYSHYFYSQIIFFTKIFFLKIKLIDDYMGLGLLNKKLEKSKSKKYIFINQIKELIHGFNSPKEFLKHIIFIARKKPFVFLSELEIKLNIIIKPHIKFKSSLSLESLEGYISKKCITFNKISTYSYVKPIEISGLILAKLLNIYEPNNDKETGIVSSIESESTDKNSLEVNNNNNSNNLRVIHNYSRDNTSKPNASNSKKGYYKSKRMIKVDNNENNSNLFLPEESLDEYSHDYCLNKNISKIQSSVVNLSLKKKGLNSPKKINIKKSPCVLFWKDIYDKISISLSPICYKLIYNYEEKNINTNAKNKNSFTNYLKCEYMINNSEILKNWNECNLNIFQKIRTCSGNAEFALFKTYIYLFIYHFFIKKDINESKKVLSGMKSIYKTGFFKLSLNELAIFYLFQGLCQEKGGDEYFSKTLMLFILQYGDPRGRNNDSHGIIQYPLWMITSEILKLKEIIIYEYFKEMYQSLVYFESKRDDEISKNNDKKIFDYVNNIKQNIDNLLFLNIGNKSNYKLDNIKANISYNSLAIFNRKKSDDFEFSQNNLSLKNIFLFQEETDNFISNSIFDKSIINKEKISSFYFPSINNKSQIKIEDYYNKDFAVYIIKQIQSIFLNRHQIFDNEYLNSIISTDIFIQNINISQSIEISSSNDSTYTEPKIKEEISNKTINTKRNIKIENSNENSFIQFLNHELLDKLSYKKNIPSGVIVSFGNNKHNETSHDKYDILTLPRVVFKLKNVIIDNIYSGWEHSIVTSKKGEIYSFGYNQSYQCGLPNINNFSQNSIPDPTNISKLYNIYAESISCGNEHTLILTSNKEVYGIGSNEDGVLGYNDITMKTYKPLLIHFGEKDEYTKKIVQISSGTIHNLALTENGKVFSWGAAMGGQLGHDEKFLIKNSNGKKNYYLSKPSIISTLSDKKIIINKISCGEAHSIGMTNTGSVYSWGFGSNGQLGLGFCEDSFEPGKGLIKSRKMIPEKININCIKDVQCGKTFSMFINNQHKLFACGNNDLCQLGLKSELNTETKKCYDLVLPTILDSISTFEVMKISCGEGHCLAIINDSTFLKMKSLWSWGNNKYGQIGQGSLVKVGLPAPINLLLDYNSDKCEFAEISCGGFHSLCLIKYKKNINWIFDDFDKKISKAIDDINI